MNDKLNASDIDILLEHLPDDLPARARAALDRVTAVIAPLPIGRGPVTEDRQVDVLTRLPVGSLVEVELTDAFGKGCVDWIFRMVAGWTDQAGGPVAISPFVGLMTVRFIPEDAQ